MEQPPPSAPAAVVVVPVYRHWGAARVLVDALRRQTLPAPRFRVVLVDNEPDRPDPLRLAPEPPWLTVIDEPRPGSYAARNRGAEAWPEAPVLAFVDADCVPSPGWLAAGLAALARLDAPGAVGGAAEVTAARPGRPTLVEAFDAAFSLRQEHYVRRSRFAATANLFVHRDAWRRAGPFDPALKSSGDAEWGQRATGLGVPLAFDAAARVTHPARTSLAALVAKARRLAGGFADRAPATRGLWRALGEDLRSEAQRVAENLADLGRAPLGARGPRRLGLAALAVLLGGVRLEERLRVRLGARSRRA